MNETEIPKERYISPHKRQQIIDELRLIWYNIIMEYQNNNNNNNNKLARQNTKPVI